jgi:hypothetical protein
MARNTKSALPPAAAPDWREQAEAAGRAAFEAATEPQPTPEPALAWLQKHSPRKKESHNEDESDDRARLGEKNAKGQS